MRAILLDSVAAGYRRWEASSFSDLAFQSLHDVSLMLHLSLCAYARRGNSMMLLSNRSYLVSSRVIPTGLFAGMLRMTRRRFGAGTTWISAPSCHRLISPDISRCQFVAGG